MKTDQIKNTIITNASECKRLHDYIHETYENRNKGEKERQEWQKACEDFRERYDQLAFPGGYNGALERIIAGESFTIEAALCFLECRPYFFRSGYMFKSIMRKIKRATLNNLQAERLAIVVEKYDEYRKKRQQKEEA